MFSIAQIRGVIASDGKENLRFDRTVNSLSMSRPANTRLEAIENHRESVLSCWKINGKRGIIPLLPFVMFDAGTPRSERSNLSNICNIYWNHRPNYNR
jgi:hypothetical protein